MRGKRKSPVTRHRSPGRKSRPQDTRHQAPGTKRQSQGTRPQSPVPSSLYGLVLTGGKSKRMGHDKSRIKYHGKEQYLHCFDLLSQFCEKVYISYRAGQRINKKFPHIPDSSKFSRIGPLGGILSAMKTHPDVAWLVLACDLPLVDTSVLKDLIRQRNPGKLATAYGNSASYLPEPLCAIYEPLILPNLLNFLKQGITCPRKILIQSDFELLTLRNKNALDNANTQTESLEFTRRLAQPVAR